jgi:hypothetical protein
VSPISAAQVLLAQIPANNTINFAAKSVANDHGWQGLGLAELSKIPLVLQPHKTRRFVLRPLRAGAYPIRIDVEAEPNSRAHRLQVLRPQPFAEK